MKVTPVATGASTPENTSIGRSADPERISRAKLVASGKEAPPEVRQEEPKEQSNVKKIRMKTQQSVYRDLPPETPAETDQKDTEVNNNYTNEQVNEGSDDTKKPIDPKVALAAQIKRAVAKVAQEKDAKIKELEAKISASSTPEEQDEMIPLSALKANPLGILLERGVTYDQLAEEALSGAGSKPNPEIARLKAEVKALKEGFDNQNKNLADKDQATEAQVINQMKLDARDIVQSSEQYEQIKAVGPHAINEAVRLTNEIYKKEGRLIDLTVALDEIESILVEDAVKFAQTKKVQSKLVPTSKEQTAQQNNKNVRGIRTLTNRDGASRPMSARERAINAFYGRK